MEHVQNHNKSRLQKNAMYNFTAIIFLKERGNNAPQSQQNRKVKAGVVRTNAQKGLKNINQRHQPGRNPKEREREKESKRGIQTKAGPLLQKGRCVY